MYNLEMGKYIWPHKIGDAAYWYLQVLREFRREVSLTEFLEKISDPRFGKRPSRRNVQRQLYTLHLSGLIDKRGGYNNAKFTINENGIARLNGLTFLNHSKNEPLTWDKHWRLVIFDIPESLREARHHVRRLLKELGFQQLQLSVWIHPFPVLKEFEVIRDAYGIQTHLILMEVVNYQPSQDLLKQFQKLYPKHFK